MGHNKLTYRGKVRGYSQTRGLNYERQRSIQRIKHITI